MLRKSKVCLLLALALLLCIGSLSTAFATNLNGDRALIGTEDNPVQAAITKNLRLPTGTNVPDASFRFQVTPIEVDEVPFNATPPNMPPLGVNNQFTISFSAADASLKAPVDGLINTDSIKKETGNIFAGVDFPHAGIFVYEIEEVPDTNILIDPPTNVNEWLSYSNAKYTLTVFVRYKAPPNETETYVYALVTVITTPGEGQTAGDKVDPTPGGYEDHYLHSQMAFINDYVKNNGPFDPEGEFSSLTISKQVAGDLASKEQLFTFTINLTIPSIVPNPPTYYRAFRVEGGVAEGNYIQISATGETEFTLRHGQSLVFVDAPVGIGYSLVEAASLHYRPSVDLITAGVGPVTISEPNPNTVLLTGSQLIGDGANSAAFTNTRDSITPTGLILSNLPFFLLIALGLGAIVTLTVVKVHRRNRYDR